MTKEEEIFRMIYTGEEREWDHAALVLEHEEQEKEYFAMADEKDSSVHVKDFGKSSVHGGKDRRVNLSLSGYGYGQRKPDFSATPDSLNLYMSVREARAVITKLEELLKATKEKVS